MNCFCGTYNHFYKTNEILFNDFSLRYDWRYRKFLPCYFLLYTLVISNINNVFNVVVIYLTLLTT